MEWVDEIYDNTFVTVNNDYLLSSEVIYQWFAKSLENHITSDR